MTNSKPDATLNGQTTGGQLKSLCSKFDHTQWQEMRIHNLRSLWVAFTCFLNFPHFFSRTPLEFLT